MCINVDTNDGRTGRVEFRDWLLVTGYEVSLGVVPMSADAAGIGCDSFNVYQC